MAEYLESLFKFYWIKLQSQEEVILRTNTEICDEQILIYLKQIHKLIKNVVVLNKFVVLMLLFSYHKKACFARKILLIEVVSLQPLSLWLLRSSITQQSKLLLIIDCPLKLLPVLTSFCAEMFAEVRENGNKLPAFYI